MPAPVAAKKFHIPFSGGAATVVCFAKYHFDNKESVDILAGFIVKYNADGTTESLGSIDRSFMHASASVNNGVMEVELSPGVGVTITDSRCCIIPGDPFA